MDVVVDEVIAVLEVLPSEMQSVPISSSTLPDSSG